MPPARSCCGGAQLALTTVGPPMAGGRAVTAVVVTRDRCQVLQRTLAAITAQSLAPTAVCVVDNASTDATAAMLEREWPCVDYVRLPGNLGYAAGLATGMRRWVERRADLLWLMDDDSRPAPTALARLVEVTERVPRCGVVGLSGGRLRLGVPVHWHQPEPARWRPDAGAFRADFALLDGGLARASAVVDIGYPRADFFMMMEDVEYTGRMVREGWEVLLLDGPLIERDHLGSRGGVQPSAPPWRGYYQTRNHLRIALEHRSPRELIGWSARQARFVAGTVASGDRVGERLRLRRLGAWHGLRRVSGRTIEPLSRAADFGATGQTPTA